MTWQEYEFTHNRSDTNDQIQKQIMLLHCFLFIIESSGAAEFTHCTFKKWCINTETEFQEIV